MDEVARELELLLRALQDILNRLDSDYRLVCLADGPLPEGTLDVELAEYWSQRDIETTLQGLVSDQQLQALESGGWAVIACSPNGRQFRLRHACSKSIVSAET